MQHKPYNFRPVPTINYARLKFTLILLSLLSLGYYVKADDKPQIIYVDSTDSVKMQLQVKIAIQQIQIKDLMHENSTHILDNLKVAVIALVIGFSLAVLMNRNDNQDRLVK
jgi:hypothetical protein